MNAQPTKRYFEVVNIIDDNIPGGEGDENEEYFSIKWNLEGINVLFEEHRVTETIVLNIYIARERPDNFLESWEYTLPTLVTISKEYISACKKKKQKVMLICSGNIDVSLQNWQQILKERLREKIFG